MVMLPCLPKHAARPVALCRNESGSGWWLYFIGADGAVVSGPHVSYNYLIDEVMPVDLVRVNHALDGQLVTVVWLPAQRVILVRTSYAGGKPYVFHLERSGRVIHREW